MSALAELSLSRIAQGLPVFEGASLPEQLENGRAAAETALRKYAADFAFDEKGAKAVTRRIDAWADRNSASLSKAMRSTEGDLPEALQLAMGSTTEVGQFLIASFTLAAAGLGPWRSGAVARSVAEGGHAKSWAQMDAESRLQVFGIIVSMDQSGELGPIFQPGATGALGVAPAVIGIIVVATIIFAAIVVTYVYLNRRLEVNNRLMRDLCEEAQARGDYATVEDCIAATRDLQVSMFEDVGDKLLTGALIIGGAYLALMFGPRLIASALSSGKRAYAKNERVPRLTPAQSKKRIAELRRRGCEVHQVVVGDDVVVLRRCP